MKVEACVRVSRSAFRVVVVVLLHANRYRVRFARAAFSVYLPNTRVYGYRASNSSFRVYLPYDRQVLAFGFPNSRLRARLLYLGVSIRVGDAYARLGLRLLGLGVFQVKSARLSIFERFFHTSSLGDVQALLRYRVLPAIVVGSSARAITLFRGRVVMLRLCVRLYKLVLRLVCDTVFLVLVGDTNVVLAIIAIITIVIVTIVVVVVIVVVVTIVVVVVPIYRRGRPFRAFRPYRFQRANSRGAADDYRPSSRDARGPHYSRRSFYGLLRLASSFLFLWDGLLGGSMVFQGRFNAVYATVLVDPGVVEVTETVVERPVPVIEVPIPIVATGDPTPTAATTVPPADGTVTPVPGPAVDRGKDDGVPATGIEVPPATPLAGKRVGADEVATEVDAT